MKKKTIIRIILAIVVIITVELFQFNGIPHYETITPDGRHVRDDFSISGYHDFENELEKVMEKLK